MPNMLAQYRGFELNATAYETAQGFAPQVCLTKHNGSNTSESILTLPTPAEPYMNMNVALAAAIEYGKAAVDGRVAGFDPSTMC